MTLGRQLLIGISAAFLILLIGIEFIYVTNARKHLEEQLNAHANETATSLALSISSRMQTLDPSLVNVLVNPVFDRGHFSLIEIKTIDGRSVLSRKLERPENALPDWFIRLVAIEPPAGRSLITAGWRQLGNVTVQVHPQYAYLQLWQTALGTLLWLCLLFALAMVAMRVYLSGILKPLFLIEQTAIAIGNRDFVSIEIEPRARELQQVTHAINSLSSKVRNAISHETEVAERLRREAFEDPMTGKFNRRGFDNAVVAALATSQEVHSGSLVLASISGLEEINRAVGLVKGNQVLKQLADALSDPHAPGGTPLIGRWQGPMFAAFLANAGKDTVVSWTSGLCQHFSEQLHASGLPASITVHAGIGHFSTESISFDALRRLAEAASLQALAGGGVICVEKHSGSEEQADMWTEVGRALQAGRVSLVFQKVAAIPGGEALQYEFLGTLTDGQGQTISAGIFVPIASQHGLLPALDGRVVEQAIAALRRVHSLPPSVSVNVAIQSVLDSGFRQGLSELLTANPLEAKRLVFEMTGASASKSLDAIKAFAAELNAAGSQLALDNFEMERNAVALVHDVKPAYVKLAPVFTREIAERADARFILEAMLRVFRQLEIPVIAQGVENASLVTTLAEIGVSGYQGYVLGRPEPLRD